MGNRKHKSFQMDQRKMGIDRKIKTAHLNIATVRHTRTQYSVHKRKKHLVKFDSSFCPIFWDARSVSARASSTILRRRSRSPTGKQFRESSQIASALCRTRRASPEPFHPD